MATFAHGVPCWIDMGNREVDAAAAFYAELLGWDVPEADEEMGGYRVATLDGKAVAGLSPMQETPGPGFWTTYVNVDDADATCARASEAGGAVLMPAMDVMDLGRMAILTDPAGAAFGLWQAGTFAGVETDNGPGALCWNELITDDTEGSKAFYAQALGWGERTSDGGGMTYTEWQVDGRSVGGMMAKPPMMPAGAPNFWGVYFAVTDVDAALAKATGLGGSAMTGIIDSPAGRFVPIADPTGAGFSLIELPGEG